MPSLSEKDMKDKEEEYNKTNGTFGFLFPHEKIIKLIKSVKHD